MNVWAKSLLLGILLLFAVGWIIYPDKWTIPSYEVTVLEKYESQSSESKRVRTNFILVYNIESLNRIHSTRVDPATFYVAKVGDKLNLRVRVDRLGGWEFFFGLIDVLIFSGIIVLAGMFVLGKALED